MKYLFDTSAWIEIIKGTEKGGFARSLVKRKRNTIVAIDATFAELFSWAIRNDHEPGDALLMVRNSAHIFAVYPNIWIEGAACKEEERKRKPDFGLVDGLLLAAQKLTGATIVTTDPHFYGLKKVKML